MTPHVESGKSDEAAERDRGSRSGFAADGGRSLSGMSPRDQSQAQPRDARPERIQGGEKPLLQGHLKKKRFSPQPRIERDADVEVPPAPETPAAPPVESPAPEAKGKRTRGKAETATTSHLEGSEQGPT
jgi:hypothetical protein